MATTLTILDKAKLKLRISHNVLDLIIQDEIDSAKAEMERAGIEESNIVDTDPLIEQAILTYVQYLHTEDEKMKDGFFVSWQYQLDCLRKTEDYRNVRSAD